jgi:NAD-dependent SIR2 family protein deacetylase
MRKICCDKCGNDIQFPKVNYVFVKDRDKRWDLCEYCYQQLVKFIEARP